MSNLKYRRVGNPGDWITKISTKSSADLNYKFGTVTTLPIKDLWNFSDPLLPEPPKLCFDIKSLDEIILEDQEDGIVEDISDNEVEDIEDIEDIKILYVKDSKAFSPDNMYVWSGDAPETPIVLA